MKLIPALLFAALLPASAQRVAEFAAARQQAKSTNRPIVVLFTGAEWNAPSRSLLELWDRPEFASSLASKALLVSIDRKDADQSDKDPEARILSFPGVALFDSAGRLVASRAGVSQIQAAGGLHRCIATMLKVLDERDGHWAKAAGAAGAAKAALIGAGLDRMNLRLGPRNVYQPEFEQMEKADPKDISGYVGKYRFSSEKYIDRIAEAKDEAGYASIAGELEAHERNARLDSRQRQELFAARFALYQKWPDKNTLARKALEAARDVDPRSDLGIAAAEYLRMLRQ